uniref:Uncharacterized protein n=1 Tax=Arundo donax TaxID=35708 RepID=A0A0A9ERJ0_ARUDO
MSFVRFVKHATDRFF